jgi:hypothetical protein
MFFLEGLGLLARSRSRASTAGHDTRALQAWLGHKNIQPPALEKRILEAPATPSAFEEVANGWLLLAEQMEWIDRQRSPVRDEENNRSVR